MGITEKQQCRYCAFLALDDYNGYNNASALSATHLDVFTTVNAGKGFGCVAADWRKY